MKAAVPLALALMLLQLWWSFLARTLLDEATVDVSPAEAHP